MKSVLLLICALALFTGIAPAGEKSAPTGLKWLSFDEAQAIAAKEKKTILVDVYTDWCGWCKKMDATTYGDPKVMKYLAQKYVIAKLNPEEEGTVTVQGKKITKQEFAQAVGVKGFPTLVFFNDKGEMITGLSSYLDAKQFLNVATFIGDGKYETMTWDQYSKSLKD